MPPTISAAHPLVSVQNISVAFNDSIVLDALSLDVHEGEHCALIGPNGAGKSTLLKLMAGVLRLSQVPVARAAVQVEVRQAGMGSSEAISAKDLSSGLSTENCLASHFLPDAPNGRILYAFSGMPDPSTLEAKAAIRLVSPGQQAEYARQGWKVTGEEIVLSGYENTALLYSVKDQEQAIAVRNYFSKVGLEHLWKMEAPEMSQGQLRACLILRALVSYPKLLLLDEPFEGLDKHARAALARLLALAAGQGCTLFITAHRSRDIPFQVDRLLTIEQGKIHALAGSQPIDLEHSHLSTDTGNLPFTQEQLTFLGKPSELPLIELQDVDVFIDRKQVLFGLNWRVNKGEQWVITGRNGAGKTTLMRLLYGEEFAAFGGLLRLEGKELMPIEERHAFLGIVSDKLQQLYEYDITAKAVVMSGFGGSIGVYRDFTPQEYTLADEWMARLGITSFAHADFHSLSSGQGRRVLLARALVSAPPVLMLDEPFSGLDPQSRGYCLNLLPALAAAGMTILLISHHEDDFGSMFTHHLALEKGRITECGTVSP